MMLWMKIIVITLVLFIILDIYRFLLNIFRPNKNNKKVIFEILLLLSSIIICYISLTIVENHKYNIYYFISALILIIIILGLFIYDIGINKDKITIFSVKNAIDLSTDGIMFIHKDKIVLSNIVMDDILKRLKINNNFIEEIKKKSIKSINNLYIIKIDNKIWGININENEIKASDITKEYKLQEELSERNREIEKNNKIILKTIKKVDEIDKEKNILKIKNNFHDILGHRLSLLKQYLNMDKVNNKDIKFLIDSLFEDTTSNNYEKNLTELVDMYKLLGINIIVTGSLNFDIKIAKVFFEIIREGITNAIIHANSKNIKIIINDSKNKKELIITNDGKRTNKTIHENEGIKGMRRKLKEINGILIIDNTKIFTLKVIV